MPSSHSLNVCLRFADVAEDEQSICWRSYFERVWYHIHWLSILMGPFSSKFKVWWRVLQKVVFFLVGYIQFFSYAWDWQRSRAFFVFFHNASRAAWFSNFSLIVSSVAIFYSLPTAFYAGLVSVLLSAMKINCEEFSLLLPEILQK